MWAFIAYIWFRLDRVSKYRARLREELRIKSDAQFAQGDFTSWKRLYQDYELVSFDTMVWKFWVWPLSKFYEDRV